MLQDIRDNSQGVVAKVIIGLIIAVFALWGVEAIIGGFVGSPPVAEINGEEITEAQLQVNTQILLNSLGANAGSLDQDLLEEIALNQLIEEMVLRQSAASYNLSVSSDAVDRTIVRSPQFQIGGEFDPELAVRTMASQGYSVPLYREQLQQQMVLSQIANGYSSSNFITDAELEAFARLFGQSRDFRYVSVTMGTRTLDTPITDAEIERYYTGNQEQFAEPESVVVEYVLLDKNAIANEISVPESDLRAQFESERSEFEGSSEKRASHILFALSGDQNEAQAMGAANAAAARLASGESFAALAMELSSDRASAEEGGDIGYSDGFAFPPEIEEALEGMSQGEVSEPILTDFGVHLVLLTESNETEYQDFEEVRDRIERELKSAEVELAYGERLADLSNLAFETGDLTTISTELELETQLSPAFSRQGGNGLFANPNVIAAAYSDSVFLDGNNSDVVELSDDQAMVLRIAEVNEASIRPLEEVQTEIAVLLRTQMEREAVQNIGSELLSAVENEESVDELMAEYDLSWIEHEDVSRNTFVVNQQILQSVFAMQAPEGESRVDTVTLSNGTFALIELTAVNPGSLADLGETERAELKQQMLGDLGGSDFQAYLANLRESADIQARVIEDDF